MRQNHESSKLFDPFVAIDIETTGLSHRRGHRIIEIGAVAVVDGAIVSEFHSLINVSKAISKSAWRIHGITQEMLSDSPTSAEVIYAFRTFVGNKSLVAHNARFDTGFLRHEYARHGYRFESRCFCTLRLAKKVLPFLTDHKLETVYRHVFGGVPNGLRLHRALTDARLVADLWVELNRIHYNSFVTQAGTRCE